jgi:hypothetical protein
MGLDSDASGRRSCAVSTHLCAVEMRSHERDAPTHSTINSQASYLMCTPEMARAMINLWISLVPSKIV